MYYTEVDYPSRSRDKRRASASRLRVRHTAEPAHGGRLLGARLQGTQLLFVEFEVAGERAERADRNDLARVAIALGTDGEHVRSSATTLGLQAR